MPALRFEPRMLFLSTDPARVRAQLAGQALSLAAAAPLRDDVSTDEITPLPVMVHFDATLGRYPYLGFKAGDRDADRRATRSATPASRSSSPASATARARRASTAWSPSCRQACAW